MSDYKQLKQLVFCSGRSTSGAAKQLTDLLEQLTTLQSELANVNAYAARCGMLRQEPSTKGLLEALSAHKANKER